MKSFLLRRVLLSIPVVLGVCTLVFALIHLIPGDPVQAMLGEGSSASDQADLRLRLGLDKPLPGQFARFVTGLTIGNLGDSLRYHEPVLDLIASRYPATMMLATSSSILALMVALPVGALAAVSRGGTWDRLSSALSLLGLSLPSFWVGPLLILWFSVRLGWLPVSGMEDSGAIVLPSVTLGIGLAATLSRMVRASLAEEISSPHCTAAAARGVARWKVVLRHSLKNALVPVVTVLGLQLGVLLTGAVITETVFGWPGLGRLTMQAIETRDYPLVQGCVLIISLTYVLVNLLIDMLYAYLDPRIRYG